MAAPQSLEAQLCSLLGASLDPSLDPAKSKAVLDALKALEASPEFSTALLRLTSAAAVEHPVRQSAATYFKNLVKRAWVSQWRACSEGAPGRAGRAARNKNPPPFCPTDTHTAHRTHFASHTHPLPV
jgi:hypothetical protein